MADVIYTIEELRKFDVRLHWIYRRTLRKGDGSGISHVPENYLTLWLIEKGEVTVETEGKGKKVISSGQWFVCEQGAKRVQSFAEKTKLISVWFDIRYEDHGQPLFSNLPLFFDETENLKLKNGCLEIVELLKQSGVDTVFQLGRESLSLSAMVRVQMKVMELFCEVMQTLTEFGCLLTVKKAVDCRVKSTMKILNELGYTGTVPYDDLRRISGLSRVQLDRLFVKELGMTPKNYLSQKCVQSAVSLLGTGSYTVQEVAYRLNFMNSAHFCTWFKRQTGQSPKQFRLLYC